MPKFKFSEAAHHMMQIGDKLIHGGEHIELTEEEAATVNDRRLVQVDDGAKREDDAPEPEATTSQPEVPDRPVDVNRPVEDKS